MKTNEKITKELGFAILEAAGWEKVSLFCHLYQLYLKVLPD